MPVQLLLGISAHTATTSAAVLRSSLQAGRIEQTEGSALGFLPLCAEFVKLLLVQRLLLSQSHRRSKVQSDLIEIMYELEK